MSLLKRIERGQKPEDEIRTTKLEELRLKRRPASPARDTFSELKTRVQKKVIAELDPRMDLSQTGEVRAVIEEMFSTVLAEENAVLSRTERSVLLEQIVAEIMGLGPLEPLLQDETLTEIMVNGAESIYIEREGKITKTSYNFESDEHVMRIIDRIVAPLGRRVDESQPYVDARLPDGSRVNVIIPPLSIQGPIITIRLFSKVPYSMEDLIGFGTLTPEIAEFLEICVKSRLNVVISGGTGSGKTTTLNVLSAYIPNDERIITIENAAELQLQQEHVISLESRLPNIEGKGEVTIRDLVINSLRMRPDRIVVGEVRGGEALDMLQAMNTGHDGGMTTCHSNSPRDTLARLETMVLMAGTDLPHRAIREQVSSALHLIVHQERLRDGSRKLVSITEVQGMEGNVIVLQDLFAFEQTGFDDGRIVGQLRPTGVRPKFTELIDGAGYHLDADLFGYDPRGRFRG
ncbi:MAG: CpaF family protein [Anaerolineae bacterium]|nr:CpaF family protein [Anaerolineae bacterium]NIO00399.1 CpaF family protein [Anaerolineae bacterium]NIQ83169.1 CpaF family protein [Anaerolineae bacterium]